MDLVDPFGRPTASLLGPRSAELPPATASARRLMRVGSQRTRKGARVSERKSHRESLVPPIRGPRCMRMCDPWYTFHRAYVCMFSGGLLLKGCLKNPMKINRMHTSGRDWLTYGCDHCGPLRMERGTAALTRPVFQMVDSSTYGRPFWEGTWSTCGAGRPHPS